MREPGLMPRILKSNGLSFNGDQPDVGRILNPEVTQIANVGTGEVENGKVRIKTNFDNSIVSVIALTRSGNAGCLPVGSGKRTNAVYVYLMTMKFPVSYSLSCSVSIVTIPR
jgi:hypothetical protein